MAARNAVQRLSWEGLIYRVRPRGVRGRVARAPPGRQPADAILLDVPEGSPLLVENRVIQNQDGRPLGAHSARAVYGLDVQFEVELPSGNGS
jgi:DNA-binding GntR family transcriptional regulator